MTWGVVSIATICPPKIILWAVAARPHSVALVVVLVCTGVRTYKPRENLIYDIAPKDAGRFPMIEKHSRIHKEHYGGDKRVVRTTKGYKYGSAYPIYHVRNSLQIT